jgi:hypothetical protein
MAVKSTRKVNKLKLAYKSLHEQRAEQAKSNPCVSAKQQTTAPPHAPPQAQSAASITSQQPPHTELKPASRILAASFIAYMHTQLHQFQQPCCSLQVYQFTK